MDKEILRSLLDPKKIAVLKTLYFASKEMYLREIAKQSQVSLSSVFRILQELTKIKLVCVREKGLMKFFSLIKNERTLFLEDWFKEETPLEKFISEIKKLKGIKKILLHGKTETHQANLLLIGENLNEEAIRLASEKIKKKGFHLSYVLLTEEQFEKLNKMGLYHEEKKIL